MINTPHPGRPGPAASATPPLRPNGLPEPIRLTPVLVDRLFEKWHDPARPFSPALLGGVLAAGAVGVVALGGGWRDGALHNGLNLVLAAVAIACVALPAAWSAGRIVAAPGRRTARDPRGRSRINRTGLAFCLLALALAALAAFRDSPWVVGLGVLLALPVAAYGVTGGRTWTEVIGGGLVLPFVLPHAAPWVARGVRGTVTSGRFRLGPIVRTGLIAGALLLVFGGLFANADAAFGDLAKGLVPDVSPAAQTWRIVTGAGTAFLALALTSLAMAPPPLRVLAPSRPAPAGRWTWAVPIAALDLLFFAFCAIQANVLLASDRDEVLRSTGLTYAEYARQGFFQLVIVTVLVLAVVAFAVRYAPLGTRRDRALVRTLLGLLCALTLVVVAVALRRLYLYEENSGWTRLRLWVHAFELWLGLVVVMVAAAGATFKASWLPRAVAASGAAAFIGLAVLNPDAFIAERDVSRFEHTGRIDLGYLSGLSADAVPALDRLPEPQRSCALREIAYRLTRDEPGLAANLARHDARAVLHRRPVASAPCRAPG
ncbi:DUF4153 domain-containing protein [Actinomadura xylanilytica]|uniref:DUF4153 domain-containing protein n=1 Tax=Actinomadura xylanilytica TaxID=887459 RepID=UPI00255AD092|nr:DUF4173 domain-containing protein [Actinomadura xylanilytica]MDL4773282.1 DUF4173 domain-containing protein [Actinomadura xylanilytica]